MNLLEELIKVKRDVNYIKLDKLCNYESRIVIRSHYNDVESLPNIDVLVEYNTILIDAIQFLDKLIGYLDYTYKLNINKLKIFSKYSCTVNYRRIIEDYVEFSISLDYTIYLSSLNYFDRIIYGLVIEEEGELEEIVFS